MKKIIVLSAIQLAFAASGVMAQQTPPTPTPPSAGANHPNEMHKKEMQSPEHRAKKRTEMMSKELGLNADQQSKVYNVQLNFIKQRDALQQKRATMDKDAFKKEAKMLNEKRDADLKSILTPEQFAKHQKMMEEQKKHKGQEGMHNENDAPNEEPNR